ncbi:MAG: hypothetical protein N2544_06120 [Burkholderiales bacterium]|nr:hypothetical protein [Burkholderiales bacterium]
MRRIALAAAALAAALPALAEGPPRFAFGAFGDTPYLPGESLVVASMIGEMNAAGLAFVVHVGDLKSSRTPCTDAVLADRRALLEGLAVPLVVLPGDNDWLDCDAPVAGAYDPLERLAKFRTLFHGGETSLGPRPITLDRQSADPRFADYREHVRWRRGDVLFVGVNVPGTNNNRRPPPRGEAEYRARSDAVNAWLAESFAAAAREGLRGVVVFLHANPGLGGKSVPRGWPDGYEALRRELAAHARSFAGPVLVVHGDTHRFRIDRPLDDPQSGRTLANVTRVEVFGAPWNGWVRVDVDPASPDLFRIRGEPHGVPRE